MQDQEEVEPINKPVESLEHSFHRFLSNFENMCKKTNNKLPVNLFLQEVFVLRPSINTRNNQTPWKQALEPLEKL